MGMLGRNKRWTCHKIKVGVVVIVELVVVAIVAVGVVGGRRCVAMTRRRASLAIGTLCSMGGINGGHAIK
jgi:hypothetical protein